MYTEVEGGSLAEVLRLGNDVRKLGDDWLEQVNEGNGVDGVDCLWDTERIYVYSAALEGLKQR